jgi:hypothetical protein
MQRHDLGMVHRRKHRGHERHEGHSNGPDGQPVGGNAQDVAELAGRAIVRRLRESGVGAEGASTASGSGNRRGSFATPFAPDSHPAPPPSLMETDRRRGPPAIVASAVITLSGPPAHFRCSGHPGDTRRDHRQAQGITRCRSSGPRCRGAPEQRTHGR